MAFAAEAQKRCWQFSDGGWGIQGQWLTFTPKDGEVVYRYLGPDLGMKEKLAKEAVEQFLAENGQLIEDNGRLAQPDADSGSMFMWKHAMIISSSQHGGDDH
jgi:hypothetical protein